MAFLARILLALFLCFTTAGGVTEPELDAATSALRAAGYNLFPNAIDTTDLRYRLLTAGPNSSFTLFAPPDTSLFTLDLTSPSAHHYVLALLRHVSPLGLTSSDLLGRAAHQIGPCLVPTLMPNHSLQLRASLGSVVITVSGVRISSPDVYLGQGIAVHGLERTVMEYGSQIPEDYYLYLGSGHGSGSDSEMVPDLDPVEKKTSPVVVQNRDRGSKNGGQTRRRGNRRNPGRRSGNEIHIERNDAEKE